MSLIYFISFILVLFRISSKVSNRTFEELFILFYVFYSGIVISTGFILSEFSLLDKRFFWVIITLLIAGIISIGFNSPQLKIPSREDSAFKLVGRNIQTFHLKFLSLNVFEKLISILFFGSFCIILFVQLILFIYVPSNEWDSMTGHLNRILYFLNDHTFSKLIGTNWNNDTYPRAFSAVQLFPFIFNNMNENWFKFQNQLSYIIVGISIYGSLKHLNFNKKIRLISSFICFFLPNILLQSYTTDTDIVLAAYLGSCIYFLLSFYKNNYKRDIYLFSLSFCLGLAHKITFVYAFPGLGLIILFILYHRKKQLGKILLNAGISILIFGFILVVPTGYLANYQKYQDFIGPKSATQHQSFQRAGGPEKLLKDGSRNFIRYQIDLLNPDGLRNIESIEKLNYALFDKLKTLDCFNLEKEKNFTIIPFSFHKRFEYFNGTPNLGLFYLLLGIPGILFLFFRRQKNKLLYLFFFGFLFHLMALSYTAPYDPWKGRYMISSVIFLMPISALSVGFLLKNSIYHKVLLFLITLIIILTGLFAMIFNFRNPIIDYHGKESIFKMNRIEKLMQGKPDLIPAYLKFEELVPKNAVVALGTISDDFEYPLWGKEFKRRLVLINPYEKGLQPIPDEADYLFFNSGLISPQNGDIYLGRDSTAVGIIFDGPDFYLRKLKPKND